MSTSGPAAGKFLDLEYSGGGVSIIDAVLKWPLLALSEVQNGGYIPAVLALGAGYYVGGVPGQGQSLQTYAMAYGAAGLGLYAGLMIGGSGMLMSKRK